MTIPFTKMHGAANDYVYLDGVSDGSIASRDLPALSRAMSDRHTGVGSDGLIAILPPQPGVDADVRMRMFNADGSEAEMCGNGVRCVAKFAIDHRLSDAKPIRVQTGAGVLAIDYDLDEGGRVAAATVDMGEPILDPARIPVDAAALVATDRPRTFRLNANNRAFEATMVSMGNPHAVIYVDDLGDEHTRYGPAIEAHPVFPRRINVHFVRVHGPGEVTVKHWERGSGATLACGTGACAVCVAGVVTGRTGREILAHLPGGDLRLRWDEATNHVFKTGPAAEVFSGEWPE